ncbi:unnamed protein product [Hermetia illucens]|uniref:Carboxylic ester hydrolase n=2 Tax=Hermetia illucens TaxID=343691 RepID=A0A7R8Z0F1_HERIL|nr:unnamed protein product [Hermetia illucens]
MPGYKISSFEAFLGIPYAKPPLGRLRFANPVPADPIIGVFNATTARDDCIQKNYLLKTPVILGDEDCLYLNVYRPVGASSEQPLPVMVYIYGGGFFSGTANPGITGPAYFMDTQKVILVTMAYRLGAFGFLSTGDESSPGNYALKDQSMALRWIHENILKFGGDKDSVTIFGQSAGGASVHMHMLSERSINYFHRAIVMSGNAAAPYNDYLKNPLAQARLQAKYLGIPRWNRLTSVQLIAALRRVNAIDILEAGDKFKYWHVDPMTVFRPVVEKNIPGAFMTKDPKEVVKTGAFRHIPWMITSVPYEGAVRTLSILSNKTLVEDFNKSFDELLIRLMEIEYNSPKQRNWYVQKLVDQYMNGVRVLSEKTGQGFGDMITGRAFVQPMNFTIEQYMKYADLDKNPLYLLKFNYRGAYSYSYLFAENFQNYGVVHCDELIYLFSSPSLGFNIDQESTDANVSAALVDNYVAFAIEGRPQHSEAKPCSNNQSVCEYLEFKNSENSSGFEITTSDEYDDSETTFWNNLISY